MTIKEVVAGLRELKGWECTFEEGRRIRGRGDGMTARTCPLAALAGVRLGRRLGEIDFWSMRKALGLDGTSMDRILWAADYNDPEAECATGRSGERRRRSGRGRGSRPGSTRRCAPSSWRR